MHMTDLINEIDNTPVSDMQVLYSEYAPLYEFIKDKNKIPYLTIVIDWGIKYVKEKYSDQELDWKAWSIVYLKHKFLKGRFEKKEDIYHSIDTFMKYYNDDYKEYIEQTGVTASSFDRDYGFVCIFLNKKIGN